MNLVVEDCANVPEDAVGNIGVDGTLFTAVVVVPMPNRAAASTHACSGAGNEHPLKSLSILRIHHPDVSGTSHVIVGILNIFIQQCSALCCASMAGLKSPENPDVVNLLVEVFSMRKEASACCGDP